MLTINATVPKELQDKILLKKINQSCKESFNQLYDKYWETIYNNAYKRLKDSDQAKDIVQEIFTHLWLKRENLEIENFAAYIQIAVRNRVLKVIAGKKTSHPFFAVLENLPQAGMNSDAFLLNKEFVSAYEALINTLPPKKQMIFRLRFQEDLPTKDIARYLKISRKTVQNQLGKAIEQLKLSFLLLLIAIIILLPA